MYIWRPDFYCHTIYTSGALTLSNSNISGNCLAQFEYHGQRMMGYHQSSCLSQADDLGQYYFIGQWTNSVVMMKVVGIMRHTQLVQKTHISNSSIISNSKISVYHSYWGSNYGDYRHGDVHTGGVIVFDNSTIENSVISNNGDSYIGSSYSSGTSGFTQSSYQVLARTGSEEVLHVNNSFLNSTMTPDDSEHNDVVGSSWGSFQHWYSFGISEGTAFITNTELNYYTGGMSYGTAGDANPGEGELVRRWGVEVHVVDPDGLTLTRTYLLTKIMEFGTLVLGRLDPTVAQSISVTV